MLVALHTHTLNVDIVREYFFFFNDTATTEIYTLSLHDALPISHQRYQPQYSRGSHERTHYCRPGYRVITDLHDGWASRDRKSTRLNSSHANISYAVFCLKKKTYRYVV